MKRNVCSICGRKRVSSKLKRVHNRYWACTDGRPEPCVDSPDFVVLGEIKALQKRLKWLKLKV